MIRLVEEGKVRAAGVSNFDVELLERCEALRHVDSLQPPLSLIRRQAAEAEIPWCAAHGTGVIGYSPMQSGILTDSFSSKRIESLSADDWRRRSPDFRPPRLGRNLALRDALRPIAAATRHDGERSRDRLDPRLARGDRRHRRGPDAGSGGRLDRRRRPWS